MKKNMLAETLLLSKINLVVNLLELMRVKKAMIQTMKLVEYKHLSVNLKTNNEKNQTKK